MRLRSTIVLGAVVALLVTAGFGSAPEPDTSTRTYEGTGSVGRDSPFEIFLAGGVYRHQLDTHLGCAATAGLFPAQREPAAALREVLRPSDLAVYMPTVRATGTGGFRITHPGWVTLQIGTGPECSWTYTATGRFLPPGEEPLAPGALDQPWLLWAGMAAAALAALAARRHTRRNTGTEPDRRIRVLEPGQEAPVRQRSPSQ